MYRLLQYLYNAIANQGSATGPCGVAFWQELPLCEAAGCIASPNHVREGGRDAPIGRFEVALRLKHQEIDSKASWKALSMLSRPRRGHRHATCLGAEDVHEVLGGCKASTGCHAAQSDLSANATSPKEIRRLRSARAKELDKAPAGPPKRAFRSLRAPFEAVRARGHACVRHHVHLRCGGDRCVRALHYCIHQ